MLAPDGGEAPEETAVTIFTRPLPLCAISLSRYLSRLISIAIHLIFLQFLHFYKMLLSANITKSIYVLLPYASGIPKNFNFEAVFPCFSSVITSSSAPCPPPGRTPSCRFHPTLPDRHHPECLSTAPCRRCTQSSPACARALFRYSWAFRLRSARGAPFLTSAPAWLSGRLQCVPAAYPG